VRKQGFLTPIVALAIVGCAAGAMAHGKHYSSGAPGNPDAKSRTVKIVMKEGDGEMAYEPNRIKVKRGEQIRFVIKNDGALKHEFMLATVKENAEHGKLMERFPSMEHDDPNGKTIEAGESAEMLWKFTKAGTFEFACLIPGHHQAGMHGLVVVE
jgi:uncharacterized cupredoxin-like copper-binding protein